MTRIRELPPRRALLATAAACLLSLALLLVPATAAAEAPPQLWQTGETGSGAGQTSIPRGIAADPASGHVFVADQVNRRIVEFTAHGQFVKAWGWDVVASGPGDDTVAPEDQFEICVPEDGDVCQAGTTGAGAGQFGSPQGVAVDSAGNVYVADRGLPSNRRVQKFDSEGNFLRMWGKEVNSGSSGDTEVCTNAGPPTDVCGAGGEGTGPGQFAWPAPAGSFIAIDTAGSGTTADDRVWVGDRERIQRFDTEGNHVEDWADTGGVLAGRSVRSLAVDGDGDLYAIHGGSAVRKLTPAGEQLAAPRFDLEDPNENPVSPTAVAVDAAGHVYAFGPTQYGGGFNMDPIFEFDPAGNVVEKFGTFADGESIFAEFDGSTGLATNLCPGDDPPGNLYVSNSSSTKAFVRAYGADPSGCGYVRSGKADGIEESAVTLHGAVNPLASEVSECVFEYGLTEPPYEDTAFCAESADQIGEGEDPVSVHADLTGLQAGTLYHYRLVAANSHGAANGEDATFKTLGPPVVSAQGATGIAFTEATLEAQVNPEGFATTYFFEYGADSAYGQSTAPSPLGADGDRNEHPASAAIAGLDPGTAYHWRVVATNESGRTEGPDQVLTTYVRRTPQSCPNAELRTGAGAALPDCRAYEMVSPVDKNGGDIFHLSGIVQGTAGGEKITYTAQPAFGQIEASVAGDQYLALRDPDGGWSNRGIHPPKTPGSKPVEGFFYGLFEEFLAFSPDLCSAWFLDGLSPPLTAAGQDGFWNHYRLDLCGGEGPEAVTDV
ncbi:MAG TPA: hypothetical protein VFC52_00005, partial [Solirubrobacterales bacterium]|nr:hypothetical protein [Solirubrobacterales bacterium]